MDRAEVLRLYRLIRIGTRRRRSIGSVRKPEP
jgi:hypothetical protein